jgi:beta-glucosidase
MADGPAGLRLSRQYTRDENGVHGIGSDMPESVMELMPAPAAVVMRILEKNQKITGEVLEQNCSAIPIGTALAQSWNLDFAERCGDLIGDEMERFGVHLWLAPALNIHRDIRCGRNYEYYSEDPLISGRFATAITRGVQKHPGRGTTIKHFAANNQETNRYGSNSLVSERAMREIYLRGFEIAVKESQPHALMTSYNLLNGVHTSERSDLIEDILRAEFGFKGIVMTDWIVGALNLGKKKYPVPNAARIAAAGGDLVMPGGPGDLKAMLEGLKDGTVTRRQLIINGTRVLRLAKKLTEEAEKAR